jgi:hypothetical protein
MSKKAKSEAKARRRSKKRARKAAQKALYAGWKLAGQNTKSKRSRKQTKRNTVRDVRHRLGPCGNIGCKRCNPMLAAHVPSSTPRVRKVRVRVTSSRAR